MERSSGTTIMTPIASPTHHARQVSSALDAPTTPPRRRLDTPTVALIPVLTTAASPMSTSTSRTRPTEGYPPVSRFIAQAPARASSVLPSAIPHATAAGAPMPTLVTSAPIATPGHSRYPKRRIATSEIPLAGQTSVAKPLTASMRNPRRATSTYTTASTRFRTTACTLACGTRLNIPPRLRHATMRARVFRYEPGTPREETR